MTPRVLGRSTARRTPAPWTSGSPDRRSRRWSTRSGSPACARWRCRLAARPRTPPAGGASSAARPGPIGSRCPDPGRPRRAPGGRCAMIDAMTSVVIVGGGPGGYEAALVAAQMGATVTLVDSDGIGGSAVLTDCVPSKALLAVAESATQVRESEALGITGAAGGCRRGPGRSEPAHPRPCGGPERGHRPALRAGGCSAGGRSRTPRWPGHGGGRHDLGGQRTDRGGRDPAGDRRSAPGHGQRAPRRRADPDLGAGLRPRQGTRAAGRGRLGCHRRGVRLRLPGTRLGGGPGLQPRPRASGRGSPMPPRSSRTCSSAAA